MADKPQSLSARKAAAGLPVKATTAEISKMGTVTFLDAEPSEARNPQTGEMGPGFMVTVADGDGRKFRAFVGGSVLRRDIQDMLDSNGFPFTGKFALRDPEKPAGRGNPWTLTD